jgi:hypothetical protein
VLRLKYHQTVISGFTKWFAIARTKRFMTPSSGGLSRTISRPSEQDGWWSLSRGVDAGGKVLLELVSHLGELKMKTVTIYPTAKCYAKYFEDMDTTILDVWVEVATQRIPRLRGEEQLAVMRALIEARKELATR